MLMNQIAIKFVDCFIFNLINPFHESGKNELNAAANSLDFFDGAISQRLRQGELFAFWIAFPDTVSRFLCHRLDFRESIFVA